MVSSHFQMYKSDIPTEVQQTTHGILLPMHFSHQNIWIDTMLTTVMLLKWPWVLFEHTFLDRITSKSVIRYLHCNLFLVVVYYIFRFPVSAARDAHGSHSPEHGVCALEGGEQATPHAARRPPSQAERLRAEGECRHLPHSAFITVQCRGSAATDRICEQLYYYFRNSAARRAFNHSPNRSPCAVAYPGGFSGCPETPPPTMIFLNLP